MSVRSYPTSAPARQAAPTFPRWAWLGVALLAFGFALPSWLIGARLTFEGWIAGLNFFGELFGFEGRIAAPRGTGLVVGTLFFGVLYSSTELIVVAARKLGGYGWPVIVGASLVWLLALGTDYASTAFGLLFAGDASWPDAARPVLGWVAQDAARWGVVTFLLTHVPELLMITAAFGMRKALKG